MPQCSVTPCPVDRTLLPMAVEKGMSLLSRYVKLHRVADTRLSATDRRMAASRAFADAAPADVKRQVPTQRRHGHCQQRGPQYSP